MKSNLIETRQIRIFISSTFRDMMAERDHLLHKVFPELRRYCAERDVTLFELDLRWGISEEESKQGKVVDICLKEIQNTTPFFIGLLGERYGWAPSAEECDTIAANTPVFEDYPWIKDELMNGTSITEIEIQEGVLRSPEKVHAYFYFRSPKMEVIEDFKEKPGSREAEKLAALKQRIKIQRDYPVEDYDSIEHLGELVKQDFEALVNQLFPLGALTPLEKERLEQRTFLKSMTGVYVPNPEWYAKLDAFVQSNERSIVITGESGMGKSALIANWIVRRGERPEEKILYHFIGNSRAAGDYRKITQRLINEIRDIYKLPAESSCWELSGGAQFGEGADKPDKQREILQNLLFQIANRGRLIIMLDGLDRLFDTDNAKCLKWLPVYPQNVKFIFSTTPNMGVDRSWQENFLDFLTGYLRCKIFPVEALPLKSRKRIVVEYLKLFGKDKAMTPARLDRIAADPENENPLALRALLEELRVFGVHEEIDREIDRYLAAPDLGSFYALVLERLEKIYTVGDYNLAQDVLSLIAVSRAGLTETEIKELTGVKPLYWSQLFNGAASHLTVQNGLVGFSNRFIREAVWKRYFSQKCIYGGDVMLGYRSSGMETTFRQRIVEVMEVTSSRERKYDELPFQLLALKERDKLYTFLLDFDVFDYINEKDKDELGVYYVDLEAVWLGQWGNKEEKYSLKKYFDLETDSKSKEELARLYDRIGFHIHSVVDDNSIAMEFYTRALEIRETFLGKNNPDTALSYSNIGTVYTSLEDYPKALEYHMRALEIRETVLGKNHPDTAASYHNIAKVYWDLEDNHKALEYIKRAGKNNPNTATMCNRLGMFSPYPESLEYYQQALEIRESFLGKNNLDTADSYSKVADVYSHMAEYSKALEYYTQALEIRQTILGKYDGDTAKSYNIIGDMYYSLKDYPKALKYYTQALEIYEALPKEYFASSTANSYNNIGSVYKSLRDYPKALEYFKQALEILEPQNSPVDLDYLEIYRKTIEIKEIVLGRNNLDIANSYSKIGGMYESRSDYPEALESYKQALEIKEIVLGKNNPHTADSYNNIGGVYESLGDYPQALEYHKQAMEIQKTVLGKNHPDTARSYHSMADVYFDMKDYSKAAEYYKQAIEIREDALRKNHPYTALSYDNTGIAYYLAGDYANALKYHREALEIRKNLLEEKKYKTAFSYIRLARDYEALGDTDQSLAHYRQALAIYEALGSPEADKMRKNIEALANIRK